MKYCKAGKNNMENGGGGGIEWIVQFYKNGVVVIYLT